MQKKEKRSDLRARQDALAKQLVLGLAGFVVLVAVLANLFYTPVHVVELNPDDNQKLREVLLAPDPWLVHCIGDNTSEKLNVLALETAKVCLFC